MKKLLTIVALFTGSCVFAQTYQQTQTYQQPQNVQRAASPMPSLRLNVYTTYAFDDNHVDSYYSNTSYFDGAVNGGFQYGGGIEYLPLPTTGIEISYLRLDSKAPMTYYSGSGDANAVFNIAHNYIFVGGNQYVKVNPKIEPFAGFQLGMAVYNVENPNTGNSDGTTKFAWGAKAGINIWANEKVGIKLQAALLSAVQAVGGGVYFGTGGAGAGVSGFSTYYQFNLGGGLVFNLGNK
jgi:hypothetical protein